MLIHWKFRYLNRATKEFGDRNLFLETNSLDPLTKAAVELAVEAKTRSEKRKFVGYRKLFKEDNTLKPFEDWQKNPSERRQGDPLDDYSEDETGQEISVDEIARILTGNPNARVVPHGYKQHDVQLWLSEPRPVPIGEVSLSQEDLDLLGYFARDFQELYDSAFIKDGPGRLVGLGGSNGAPIES